MSRYHRDWAIATGRTLHASSIVLAAAITACTPIYAQTKPTLGVTYAIVNSNSGKVVDVSGGSILPDTPCFQYPYHATTNQQWTAQNVGAGFWELKNVNSGLCLSVGRKANALGDPIVQTPYTGKPEQQWSFQSFSDGTNYLVNRKTNDVLDVDGASKTDGAKIQQWSNGGYSNQRWTLTPIKSLKAHRP